MKVARSIATLPGWVASVSQDVPHKAAGSILPTLRDGLPSAVC